MNENHFTLFTKWRNRRTNAPGLAIVTTRLLRFVVLLCIGLYGQNLAAQNCATCTGVVNGVFTCESQIPAAANLIDISACGANATLTFADLNDNGGSGYFGDPRIFSREYTVDPDGVPGNGNEIICSHDLYIESTSLGITNPPDVTVTLASGECGKQVFFDAPTAFGACGTGFINQTDGTGLVSGDVFPEGVTTLTYESNSNNAAFVGAPSYPASIPAQEIVITVLGNPLANNQMACNTTNVSVDENCEYLVSPANTLVGNNYGCLDGFTASVHFNLNGMPGAEIPTSPVINGDYIDQVLIVMITNPAGNSCWNTKLVEDKLGPEITCEDFTITCLQSPAPTAATTPVTSDNCELNIVPTYTDSIGDALCNADPFQTIVRTWTATDSKGNTSTCSQIISITRPVMDATTVECPPQYDGMTGNMPVLSCSGNFATDANGHPAPSVTGEPTIDGESLNSICMYDSEYSDIKSEICEGAYSIYRTWTIYNWCNSPETFTCHQVIKVMDTEGPTITCPDDMTANAYANCVANFIVPTPTITDECSPNGINYSVSASSGTVVPFGINGYIVNGLTIGAHVITYTAFDGCGQSSTCSFEVEVQDHTAPVLPCQTFTTVGLSNDGSEVNWSTFISNVTDNCGVTSVEVRRMDMAQCAGDESTEFAETVPFFCCDVNNTVTIEVQATDANGNVNTCTVFANVMDNVAPIFSPCPAAFDTIACDNLAALDVYEDVTEDADGTIDNPAPGALTYIITLTGPTAPDTTFYGYYNNNIWDNCETEVFITTTGTIDDCGNSVDANGNLFPLQRSYVAVDQSGNASVPCVQQITVENPNEFNPATDITDYPDDLVNPGVTCGSSLLPDDLPAGSQRPVVSSTVGCDNIAMGYSDSGHLYPQNATETYCYKVLRTWYVFDWCNFKHDTSTQVIMVVDPGPVFASCPGPLAFNAGDNINLDITATNLCANAAAAVSYTVDSDNDGVVDFSGNTGVINTTAGSANFPVGNYSITFTAEGCTTNSTCTVDITVSPVVAPSISNVSGSISDEDNSMLENVVVSPASGMDVVMTDLNGSFSMNLPTNVNYNITPTKDDDYLNGVSTYDIVLMSKHILQTQLLDSPYKIIAADVNNSGLVSTLDLVELRKVILFINDEFPNNESWRFVDANYAFPNPTNPFEEIFPETYAINGLTNDMEDLDFVAVKIGDVNGNAVTNGFAAGGEGRDFNGTLDMEIAEARLTAGQTHTIEVKAKDFNNLLGYQFTMAFDGLEVTDVAPANLTGLTAANFGLQRLAEGMLTTSWNNPEAQSLADGTVLFTVTVKAVTDINLSEAVRASSQYTATEAYADKAGAVELLDVNFKFRDNNGTTIANTFELYQNRPNPFKNETVIGFDLPQAGQATLTVYDLSGRVLLQAKDAYSKGYNEVSINRSDLPATGVLYYELATENNTAVRKMTIIE